MAGARISVPVHSRAFVLTSGGYRGAEQMDDETFRKRDFLRVLLSRVDRVRACGCEASSTRESHLPVALERRRGKITALDNESCQVDSLRSDPHPYGVLVGAALDVIGTPYV